MVPLSFINFLNHLATVHIQIITDLSHINIYLQSIHLLTFAQVEFSPYVIIIKFPFISFSSSQRKMPRCHAATVKKTVCFPLHTPGAHHLELITWGSSPGVHHLELITWSLLKSISVQHCSNTKTASA